MSALFKPKARDWLHQGLAGVRHGFVRQPAWIMVGKTFAEE